MLRVVVLVLVLAAGTALALWTGHVLHERRRRAREAAAREIPPAA